MVADPEIVFVAVTGFAIAPIIEFVSMPEHVVHDAGADRQGTSRTSTPRKSGTVRASRGMLAAMTMVVYIIPMSIVAAHERQILIDSVRLLEEAHLRAQHLLLVNGLNTGEPAESSSMWMGPARS
jgi:hypothetical protein